LIVSNEGLTDPLLFEVVFIPSVIIFVDEPTAGMIGAPEIYLPLSSIYCICCSYYCCYIIKSCSLD